MNCFGFALHVIHQEVFAEAVWRGEVGFAAAHFRDLVDEAYELGGGQIVDGGEDVLLALEVFVERPAGETGGLEEILDARVTSEDRRAGA